MKGEEVKTLQMTLKLKGYDIGPDGVDGVLGDSMEKSVKEFHYCEDAVNWYRSVGRYRTRQSGYIPK